MSIITNMLRVAEGSFYKAFPMIRFYEIENNLPENENCTKKITSTDESTLNRESSGKFITLHLSGTVPSPLNIYTTLTNFSTKYVVCVQGLH